MLNHVKQHFKNLIAFEIRSKSVYLAQSFLA